MKRTAILFTVLVIATLGLAAPVGAGGSCHTINAWGVGQDLGPVEGTIAQIHGGGLLQGTTVGLFEATGGELPMLEIAGPVTFTTNRATLTVSLAGTFNLATGVFTVEGPVSDATGKLTGASGYLFFDGFEDLSTFAFTETITGEICVDLGGNGKRK